MKKLFAGLMMLAAMATAEAQQLNTPQPSTTQKISQTFGLGTIDLSYSRPNAKGRKVMGDLVPFGQVWRTGANNATTIAFSDDVKIGGIDVKAGKYGLVSIPGEKEWTLILTSDLNVTSPGAYNLEKDVVRVNAPVTNTGMKAETFTMQFQNLTNTTCELHIRWENIMVALPIATDVDKKVMAQIDQAMNKDNRPYYAAAQYYYENGKDLGLAREWANKAVAANPNAYWVALLNARICAKMGDKAAAKTMCQQTLDLATKAGNGDYVKMAKELMATL